MSCVFANGEHGPCEPPLEWHHAVKQQRLKREFRYGALWAHGARVWVPAGRYDRVEERCDCYGKTLDQLLGDPRNRVWLCKRHHELVTNHRLKVVLPESVWVFAREYGLEGMLENDLRRAA